MKFMFVPSSLILTIVSVGAKAKSDNSKDEKALLGHLITGISRFHGEEKNVIVKTNNAMEGRQPTPQRRRVDVAIKSKQGGATTFGEKSINMLNVPDVGVLSRGKGFRRDGTDPRILLTTEEACNAGMCGPSYCDCYANSWLNNQTDVVSRVPCAAEIYSLCNGYTDVYGDEWTMTSCAGEYYEAFAFKQCELAKCDVVDGGTLAECMCQSSISFCANYGAAYMAQVGKESIDCQVGACCQAEVFYEGFQDCAVKYGLMEITVGPTDEIPDEGFEPSPVPPSSSTLAPAISDPSPVVSPSSSTTTCNICDGADIREDVEIPVEGLDGVTCADDVTFSQTLDASSELCAEYTSSEALCCPSAASTCSICKGAKLKADFIVPGTAGKSCGRVAYEAALFEIGSENCTIYEVAEAFCCPDADTVNNPCYLCGDGNGGDESFDAVPIPGDATGLTCGDVALVAVMFYESSEDCLAIRDMHASCCSSPPPTFSPSPPSTPFLTSDPFITEEFGSMSMSFSLSPPPTPSFPSAPTSIFTDDGSQTGATCNFCNGGEVREDMEIPYEDGTTCEDIIGPAELVGADSDECELFKSAEALCCPSEASTCSICQGTALRGDVVVPGLEGMTCAEVAYAAAGFEMTSANCTLYQDVEAFCCPDPDVHSSKCWLCGEDGVVFDDVQLQGMEDEFTCGYIALSAISYDVTSTLCNDILSMGLDDLCCMSTADPPNSSIVSYPPTYSPPSPPSSSQVPESISGETCKVCDGLEVQNDVVIPGTNGLTCEFIVFSSESVDATSDECIVAQLAQSVCCGDSETSPDAPGSADATDPTSSPAASETIPSVPKNGSVAAVPSSSFVVLTIVVVVVADAFAVV